MKQKIVTISDELLENHKYELEIWFDNLPFANFNSEIRNNMFVWQILIITIQNTMKQITDKWLKLWDLPEWVWKFILEAWKWDFEEQVHYLLPRFSIIMLKDSKKKWHARK